MNAFKAGVVTVINMAVASYVYPGDTTKQMNYLVGVCMFWCIANYFNTDK